MASEAEGRRLLDHFLVAALQRAVAFAERNHPALAVAEQLHLDMAGVGHEAFEIDARIAEAGAGGALHALERSGAGAAASAHSDMPMPPPPAVDFSITG